MDLGVMRPYYGVSNSSRSAKFEYFGLANTPMGGQELCSLQQISTLVVL
jgi:hypothetical protein